jgi:hypothetical protein
MSIFSAPAPDFYGAADKAIYNQGFSFIPREEFRGDFVAPTFPTAPTTTTGGITTVPISTGGTGSENFSVYRPDMNNVRTDFRPDTEFRRFNEFGITSLDDADTMDLKTMESYPEYFGLKTGVPKSGLASFVNTAMDFIPGIGLAKRGINLVGDALKNIIPINQRAIEENQARGAGIFTDDIGRIVGDPNTVGGVMAGYNLNKITEDTFNKRRNTISNTLSEKGISDADIQGLIDGTLDDEDIAAKYGIASNLTSKIRNLSIAQKRLLDAKQKAQEIRDFREQQRIDEINRKKAEAKAAGDARRARELQIEAARRAQNISRAEARRQQEAIERENTRDSAPGRGDRGNPGGSSGAMTDDNAGTFCFDPNTLVQMADGSEKKIKEIQLGDQTRGGEVTGVFQFKAADEIHDYKGVTVAGSHYVKENGRFIMVQDSPLSVKIDKIPVVYSLDTTGRRIFIKDIEFADYNGDGIAKGFLANAGVDLRGFDKEVLRQVENRLI